MSEESLDEVFGAVQDQVEKSYKHLVEDVKAKVESAKSGTLKKLGS